MSSQTIEYLIASSAAETVSEEDTFKNLNNGKATAKAAFHNCLYYVAIAVVILLALFAMVAYGSYFCMVVRGVDVPLPLQGFVSNSVEWVLVSLAAMQAKVIVKDHLK